MAIGVSWSFSSLKRAVTTISSRPVASCSCANVGVELNPQAAATAAEIKVRVNTEGSCSDVFLAPIGWFIANSLSPVDMASPWERAAPMHQRHSPPSSVDQIPFPLAGLHSLRRGDQLIGKSLGPRTCPL